MLKALCARRKGTPRPLRLVIMSATLDAALFEAYFAAHVVYVQGRQYPVQMRYLRQPEPNYQDAVLLTLLQIHLEEESGDVLAFLTGRYEIESLAQLLESKNALLPPHTPKLLPCPLFGAQTSGVQQQVFAPTPPGHRKVVLATNIAETSLTVPNIRYVIDTGVVKTKSYHELIGIDVLAVAPISQAQARQRAGTVL